MPPRSRMQLKMEGGDKLAEAFKTFPDKFINKVNDKALLAAGKPILAAANSGAPVNTGRMASTLINEKRKNKKTKVSYLAIGAMRLGPEPTPGKRGGKLAKYNKRFKKMGLTSDSYYIKFVHNGTRFQAANPFLKNALFEQGEAAVQAYSQTATAEVERLK